MPKQQSKLHHYLPQHYLEGFTNDQGRFYVYNKEEDRIFPATPAGTFAETHLNRMTLPDGEMTDSLEGMYSQLEGLVWPAFDAIRRSTSTTPLNPVDKMNLFLFLSVLHWRLPSNIGFADQLAEEAFRDDNEMLDYFKIVNKHTGVRAPEKALEKLRPFFKMPMRLIVPMAPFFKDPDWSLKLNNWRFIYCADGESWHIVGDNPIITSGENDHDPLTCLDEFIVPIAGNLILANTHPPTTRGFPPEIVMRFNAALIQRSDRFVAASRKDWLQAMVDFYKLYRDWQKADVLIPELFDAIRAGAASSESE